METVAVRQKPILFSGAMVRAILDGRKTQTRRVLTPQPTYLMAAVDLDHFEHIGTMKKSGRAIFEAKRRDGQWVNVFPDGPHSVKADIECPYGAVGDRLWVRETFAETEAEAGEDCLVYSADMAIAQQDHLGVLHFSPNKWTVDASAGYYAPRWKPSIHMPRWASRITLEITDISVERLQEIGMADAHSEGGCADAGHLPWIGCRQDFRQLWNGINEKRGSGWDVNPWVWVIEFKRIRP